VDNEQLELLSTRDLLVMTLEIEDEVKQLTNSTDRIREIIKHRVANEGGAYKIKGICEARVFAASSSHSYETKKIDSILSQLITDGDLLTAKLINDARKTTYRSETLRITKEKKA